MTTSEPLAFNNTHGPAKQTIQLLEEIDYSHLDLAEPSPTNASHNESAGSEATDDARRSSAVRKSVIASGLADMKIKRSKEDLYSSESVGSPKLCYLAGPFESSEARDRAVALLRDKSVHAAGQRRVSTIGWRYWLYLPPKPTRGEAEAELARVKALGVDSYLIRKGGLTNGISLGLYSSEALSDAKMAEYRGLGLTPELSRYQRKKALPWLAASKSQADAAAAPLLAAWRASGSDLQVIEKKCELPVASH